jgi:hypothetical protein
MYKAAGDSIEIKTILIRKASYYISDFVIICLFNVFVFADFSSMLNYTNEPFSVCNEILQYVRQQTEPRIAAQRGRRAIMRHNRRS